MALIFKMRHYPAANPHFHDFDDLPQFVAGLEREVDEPVIVGVDAAHFTCGVSASAPGNVALT